MERNPWLPCRPHPRQRQFLYLSDVLEVMYGGSAGGGKSAALLMAALQFADAPGYAALVLRRTFRDLSQPGALIPLSKEWLHGRAAWSDRDKRWTFPSGATLTFGYCEHADDVFQYQGAAFQFVGFDEATQFTEPQYRYLFSRLRRREGADVPLRMRAASNPGGVGHDWVKQRFLVERSPDRVFVPAKLADNPSLDREEYVKSLDQLDPFTRAQLLDGDWDVTLGELFKRHWFEVVDVPPAGLRTLRAWDLAATAAEPGKDPDYTAGVLLGRSADGVYYVLDVRLARETPRGVQQLVRRTAEEDGKAVPVWMEQEPGSSGVSVIDTYTRNVLPGWRFQGERSTGDKVTRAGPLSSQAQAGNVKLVRAPWNRHFLDQACQFPFGAHDDQVDAASLAFAKLSLGAWRRLNVWT